MPTALRALLVEDSEDDALLIVRELRRGGYDVNFERVDGREAMLRAIGTQQWDLVVCDYSMPNFSGTDALQLLRESGSQAPFIFVSGTIGEEKAVAALKLGAQDYVMKGNLKRLLPAVGRELEEVARRQEHKALEQRLTQLERFEAIGRLAGGIAHDFNNVIGVVLGLADLGARESPAESKLRERFQKIHQQANRATAITSQLLAFARKQVLQPLNLNLNESIAGMTGFLETAIGAHIDLRTVLGPELHVIKADPAQMEQILMNLCLNARDAMPGGGRLTVKTQNVEIDEEFCRIHAYGLVGNYVLLTISDSGEGMDATTLRHIFEPFFTTKELGRGTGLGLSTVYGIVKQHAGFIDVSSELGQGTTFRVYFPASSGIPQPRATVASEASGGTETILLAEDDDGLRELAHEILSSSGYQVILARDGSEAIKLFQQEVERIDLVFLDLVMPGRSGVEVSTQMRAVKPRLAVVYTTGYTQESVSLNSHIENGAVFLQKPYSPQSLMQAVRSALDKASST